MSAFPQEPATIESGRSASRRGRGRRLLLLLVLGILAGGVFYLIFDLPLLRQRAAQAAPTVDINRVRGQRIDGADRAPAVADMKSTPASAAADSAPGLISRTPRKPAPKSAAGEIDVNAIGDVIVTPDKTAAFKEFDDWSGGPDEFRPVSFGVLASFEYDPLRVIDILHRDPKAALPKQVPDKIATLDKSKIEVRGFMLPVRVEQRQVKEFLLVKNRMLCCYGAAVSLNDWVHVIVRPGVEVEPIQDVIVTVRGDFHVGEAIEDGVVMSLYRLDADVVNYNTGF